MFDECREVARFYQKQVYTCCVACLSYVFWRHGIDHHELDLLSHCIPDNVQGNTLAEVASAVNLHGFRPLVRCLPGFSHYIGEARPEWVQEIAEDEMLKWLEQSCAAGHPVIVLLKMSHLNQGRRGIHAVSVVHCRPDVVTYFDPAPPQGICRAVERDRFMAAWRALSCLATAVPPHR
jgi:hypothetical protein